MLFNRSNLSNLSFFLMTAFFVIYNLSYYIFKTPLVIGGGATAISIFVAISFSLFQLIKAIRKNQSLFFSFKVRDFLVAFWFFTWISVTFVYYVFQKPNAAYYEEIFGLAVNSWLLAFSFFLVGKYLKFDSKILYYTLLGSIIFIFVIYSLNLNSFFMFKYFDEPSDAVGYQNTGRAIILISFFIVAFKRESNITNLTILALLLLVLIFNAARSELYGFLFALVSLYFFQMSHLRKLFIASALLLSFILLGSTVSIDSLSEFRKYTVVLDVLDLSSSTSFSAREQLKSYAIQTISINPLLGNYGSYVNLGGVGFYSHNLMSVWVNFGLFGFTYFVALIFFMLSDVFFSKNMKSSKVRFFALNLFFSTFLLCFAKDYTYIPFYFLLGLWVNKSIKTELLVDSN